MYPKSVLLALAATASLVSAHGKIQSVTGDAGGAGTALGIKGDAVPRFGANDDTESDTTVFDGNRNRPMTDGLGKTTSSGELKVADIGESMKLMGDTLPQVSPNGGSISGVWRTVTSDGTANDANGNLFAVIDPTGTGAYSQGIKATATSNMVGNGKGNVVQRAVDVIMRAVGFQKRATNVGADAEFKVDIPAGTTCTGNDPASGMTNFCLLKVANNNGAGPFGGNVAFQIAGAGGAAPAAGSAPAAGGDNTAASNGGNGNGNDNGAASKGGKNTRRQAFTA
ncbi:hypothetical protein HJFPF1_13012 [Paramyrothecium foliicola]|nr:hypothetical protein HJFPF1_13012 [Paramyrothecium foliicola]